LGENVDGLLEMRVLESALDLNYPRLAVVKASLAQLMTWFDNHSLPVTQNTVPYLRGVELYGPRFSDALV
jgi:hypothetical protein